jgi:hypothetical protein
MSFPLLLACSFALSFRVGKSCSQTYLLALLLLLFFELASTPVSGLGSMSCTERRKYTFSGDGDEISIFAAVTKALDANRDWHSGCRRFVESARRNVRGLPEQSGQRSLGQSEAKRNQKLRHRVFEVRMGPMRWANAREMPKADCC